MRSVVFALGLGLSACGNECHFVERCGDGVREVCGEPGQIAGRKVRAVPCDTLNPVCVAVDDELTVCTASPVTTCEPSFVGSCDGDVLTECVDVAEIDDAPVSYVLRQDCAETGGRCEESGLGGACAPG